MNDIITIIMQNTSLPSGLLHFSDITDITGKGLEMFCHWSTWRYMTPLYVTRSPSHPVLYWMQPNTGGGKGLGMRLMANLYAELCKCLVLHIIVVNGHMLQRCKICGILAANFENRHQCLISHGHWLCTVINLRHYFDWLEISLDNQEGLHWHSLEDSSKEQ